MNDFWTHYSIEELAAAQGVRPIDDIAALAGAFDDEDIEALLAEIYKGR